MVSIGYIIQPLKRREIDADIVENIKDIIGYYFPNGQIFHDRSIKDLSILIQKMIDDLRCFQIISWRDAENIKFFIRILKYGSDLSFVLIVRWYEHDYKIVF
jgi:hypothetical protein